VTNQETPPTKLISTSNAIGVAEYRLLHAIIKKPEWLDDLRVDESLLIHSSAKILFNSLKTLKDLKVEASPFSILQQAIDKHEGISKDVIDVIYNYKEESLSNIDDIVITLRKGSKQLEIAKSLDDLAKKINNYDAPIEEISAEFYELQNQISYLAAGKSSHVLTYSEWLDQYEEEYEKRKGSKRYSFNDRVFDDMVIKGANPGDMMIIGGATGSGKTTLMLHLSKCLVAQNTPVLLFSLEMSSSTIMDRRIASIYGVDLNTLANPTPSVFEENKSYIKTEKEHAHEKTLNFSDHPYYDLVTIREEIINFQKQIGQKYCVVIIDLLSMVQDFNKSKQGSNFAQTIEVAVNQMHRIVKELEIFLIGTIQMGRSDEVKIVDFEDIQHCAPTLNSLKNSNAWAERARIVAGVFRPKYYATRYLPDDPQTKEMDDCMFVNFLKQNDGPVGRRVYMCSMDKFQLLPIHNPEGDLEGEREMEDTSLWKDI
jgi:replicative DNA helicase